MTETEPGFYGADRPVDNVMAILVIEGGSDRLMIKSIQMKGVVIKPIKLKVMMMTMMTTVMMMMMMILLCQLKRLKSQNSV